MEDFKDSYKLYPHTIIRPCPNTVKALSIPKKKKQPSVVGPFFPLNATARSRDIHSAPYEARKYLRNRPDIYYKILEWAKFEDAKLAMIAKSNSRRQLSEDSSSSFFPNVVLDEENKSSSRRPSAEKPILKPTVIPSIVPTPISVSTATSASHSRRGSAISQRGRSSLISESGHSSPLATPKLASHPHSHSTLRHRRLSSSGSNYSRLLISGKISHSQRISMVVARNSSNMTRSKSGYSALDRFRRVALRVVEAVRIIMRPKNNNLQPEREYHTTAFDFKEEWMTMSGLVHLTNDIKVLLCQTNRTDSQVDTLMECIASRLSSFKKYPVTLQRELCQLMMYSKFEAGRIVIKQGHAPRNFYIVLSGTLDVVKRDYDEGSHLYYETKVSKLEPDQTFGEIALLDNSPRNASVVSRTEVELLSIEQEGYLKVLEVSTRREALQKNYLVRNIPILASLNENIDKIAKIGQLRHFTPNMPILLEGERSDLVYIVIRGSCRCVKSFRFLEKKMENGETLIEGVDIDHPTQRTPFSRNMSVESRMSLRRTLSGRETIDSESEDKKSMFSLPTDMMRNKGFVNRVISSTVVTKLLAVQRLERESFFGLGNISSYGKRYGLKESLQGKNPMEEVSTVAGEQVDCFVLSKGDFLRMMTEKTVEYLVEQSHQRRPFKEVKESYLKQMRWSLQKARVIHDLVERKEAKIRKRVLPEMFRPR